MFGVNCCMDVKPGRQQYSRADGQKIDMGHSKCGVVQERLIKII